MIFWGKTLQTQIVRMATFEYKLAWSIGFIKMVISGDGFEFDRRAMGADPIHISRKVASVLITESGGKVTFVDVEGIGNITVYRLKEAVKFDQDDEEFMTFVMAQSAEANEDNSYNAVLMLPTSLPDIRTTIFKGNLS